MVVAQKSKNGGPVGKSVKRVDILEKVSGSATFCDDIQFGTGLYHARAKRSPIPHGRTARRLDWALLPPVLRSMIAGRLGSCRAAIARQGAVVEDRLRA